jgi:hypothetical protein
MPDHFEVLNSEEYEDLKNAISWITILIAGADGKIDTAEISWAEKLAQIRSYKIPSELNEYYKEVGEDFHERLHEMINSLPENSEDRQKFLTNKLTELNPILAKLDEEVAAEIYTSFKSFAKHVARASGGFLRFFSVSYEEKSLMDLDMIDPINIDTE